LHLCKMDRYPIKAYSRSALRWAERRNSKKRGSVLYHTIDMMLLIEHASLMSLCFED